MEALIFAVGVVLGAYVYVYFPEIKNKLINLTKKCKHTKETKNDTRRDRR